MIKKILIITAIIAILAVAAVFYYRYQLISYSAEKLIRKALPEYVQIANIKFDFNRNMAFLEGFKLEGPPGFSDRYIVEISEISCRYKLKGKTMLDGLEIVEPVLKNMVLRVERLQGGRINVAEMGSVIGQSAESKAQENKTVRSEVEPPRGGQDASNKNPGPKMSDFIKLPQEFKIKNGKIVFIDRFFVNGFNVITFDNMEAVLTLRMNDSLSQILDVTSTGESNINGHKDQSVRWTIGFNPNTPKLTMSSRFDLYTADLITFEPYYDKFSPFEFAQCRVSGVLIFNFDNGNIGSTNELHLSNLIFSVKPSYQNTAMFDTTVQDLTKYFTTFTGEVVFDFKIKGDMANPQFYLGPISKQAVAAMVMDKVGDVLQQMARKGSGQAGSIAAEAGNSGVDKTKQIVDMVKGFLDKKN